MRKGFEQELREYSKEITFSASEVHKKEKKRLRNLGRASDEKINSLTADEEVENLSKNKKSDLDGDLQVLDEQLDNSLLEAGKSQFADEIAKEKLHSLQIQKQLIMEHLKHDLTCLDNPDNPDCDHEVPKEERLASYDEERNGYIYTDDKNIERQATFGEVITDMDFGVYYDLDDTVPRAERKEYILAKAKKELRDLLDQQIIVSEMNNEDVEELKKQAYENIQLTKKDGFYDKNPAFISEMIVKNYLKQLSIDKNLPFGVIEADVYQDVEQKMDFIIHRKKDARAVKVVSDSQVEEIDIVSDPDVAIQFSLDPSKKENKLEQISKAEKRLEISDEKIKSIALVVFPEVKANNLSKKWEREGKTAGGPGKYMSMEIQEKLFRELLKGVYSQDEIDTMWKKSHEQNTDFRENEDELRMSA